MAAFFLHYCIMFTILIKRLGLSLLLFTLCRIIFLFVNHAHFHFVNFNEYLKVFASGLRFDFSAVTVINIPFILFSILPFAFLTSRNYQLFLKTIFVISNSAAITFNLIDTAYFDFANKRSTWQFILQNIKGNDLQLNAGSMLLDFYYVPLIVFMLVISIIYFYPKQKLLPTVFQNKIKYTKWVVNTILLIGFCVTAIRGGWQLKPLRMIDAAAYANPVNVPLVLNTPFCLIKTYSQQNLEIPNYFDNISDCNSFVAPCKNPSNSESVSVKKNVVVIIIESMAKEYMGFFNSGIGYTPFLDSLCNLSTTFNYSFANGSRSMEGIPAITASIPYFMDEAFITSAFNTNHINSLASSVSQLGYTTTFFHGGINGTMNFDSYCKLAGYQNYYGRNEYGQNDFDGNWGVYDEPFYHFFCTKMNITRQPFLTTFFSLSSHHPYNIPSKYKNTFPKGTLPIHESIGYADHALKTFFAEASKQEWFKNTLFVITADHTSISSNVKYQNALLKYSIPIILYDPQLPIPKLLNTPMQQIDIMPSVLDLIGYNKKFYSLGNSFLQSNINKTVVQYADGIYQIANDSIVLQYNGEKILGAYSYKTDTAMVTNFAERFEPDNFLLKKLQAYIQLHHYGMVNNKMICND